jgi:hypothetical protein
MHLSAPLITDGSQALALAIVPPPPARVRLTLDRVPVPLFAGLAAHAVSVPGADLADASMLADVAS